MSEEDLNLIKKAKRWVRKKKNVQHVIDEVIRPAELHKTQTPEVIFMAGSPGAGKTEVSKNLNTYLGSDYDLKEYARLDPDELRNYIDGYSGANAHLFQSHVSILLDSLVSYTSKNKINVIVDGTLANYDTARKNIQKYLARGFRVGILYVYQEPELAWEFTRAREAKEGRRIRKKDFINGFLAAPQNVDILKEEFGQKINLIIAKKNLDHKVEKFWINVDNINTHIKIQYSKDKLEETLNEEEF